MTYRPSALRHSLALFLALCLGVILSVPASAGSLGFGGLVGSGTDPYVPPDATGTALSDIGPQPWTGLTFWSDQRGEYTIDSKFDDQFAPTAFGRVVLYRGPVDLSAPLEHLVAVSDSDAEGDSTFDVVLEAGVVYHLVHTRYSGNDYLDVTGWIRGPGELRYSYCLPPGDDFPHFDVGGALAFENRGLNPFCAFVDWRDHQGNTGYGVTAPFRSADSGMFWFFNRDNWELLVKVLDGCAVNGHYWVFFAATTDVEFDLSVVPENLNLDGGQQYHNDLGHPADAVTDTAAFPCDELD